MNIDSKVLKKVGRNYSQIKLKVKIKINFKTIIIKKTLGNNNLIYIYIDIGKVDCIKKDISFGKIRNEVYTEYKKRDCLT